VEANEACDHFQYRVGRPLDLLLESV
jgi:hypothetical protein